MDNNKLQQSLLNAKRFMKHDKLNVSYNDTSTPTKERLVSNSGKNSPLLEEFKTPQATYNIPEDISGSAPPTTPIPKPMNMNPHSGLNEERIKSSNLPPEIKRLMIENPIQDPAGAGGATLNDDFINKVSEKMKSDEFSINGMRSTSNNNVASQPRNTKKPITSQKSNSSPIPAINENFSSSLDYGSLKKVIKECVKEVISENDLLIEKTNIKENLQLRVGNKIFIGSIKSVKTVKKK
tara:strand:+ start:1899 stop:2612 length:714 start_codon:yes stop_codon:yes gene_type:complete